MKYIYKDGSYYIFKRKIPYTNKNFSFSLKTKNLKVAKRKTSFFLKEAESLFFYLQSMTKDEILEIYEQIDNLLHDYKQRALIEYSQLEKTRQADLTHKIYSEKQDKEITVDGSHPESIEYWQNNFQDAIGSTSSLMRKGLFKRIFKRTDLPRDFYGNLSKDEQEVFEVKLIKTERDILQEDFERTLKGKDKISYSPGTNISPTELYQGFQDEKYQAMRKMTLQELKNEYIDIRLTEVADEKSIGKDKEVIAILQSVSDKTYLIDYTDEEFTQALDIILHLSPNNGKTRKLYEHYGDDYQGLVDRFRKDNFPRLSERTGWNKFRTLRSFINYAIEEDLLLKNPFQKRIYTYYNITKDLVPVKKRLSFNSSELNRLFSISSWYNPKQVVMTLHNHPERFYIPLIAFFTGMRLNEIASLSRNDIKFDEDNNIYYFDLIEVDVKNKTSKRCVPIHRFLLKKLKFLDYMNMMKNEERLFMKLTWHEDNGYGHNLSKAFNQDKFKSEWINEERLNDKNYMLDFHSFRHTALSRLDEGGVKEAKINNISGHKQKTQSQKTYITPKVKELYKYIHQLVIDDIDFSGLEAAVKEFYEKSI